MERQAALDQLGDAVIDLLQPELDKLPLAKQITVASVMDSKGGKIRIEIELPKLSVVCSMESADYETTELCRIEGGPVSTFVSRPKDN